MLKQICIQGFKSFADRICIDIFKAFTVIIGPNGSGKSNIADAVSWVLGEQRYSLLRSSRAEEIIFAGSNERKKMGMCEVSVTFDNSTHFFPLEYSEIMLTRRLFRSGESSFFINKMSIERYS